MIQIQQFLNEEIKDASKVRIYEAVLLGILKKQDRGEVVMNRYSLEFDFKNANVKIYDDAFMEDEPNQLKIEEFLDHVINYGGK